MSEVTAVRMRTELVDKPGSRLVACGSVTLNGDIRIEYTRVVRPYDGRFLVCMPSIRNAIGQYRDTVHPLNAEMRKKIDEAVLDTISSSAKEITLTREQYTALQVLDYDEAEKEKLLKTWGFFLPKSGQYRVVLVP